MLSCSTSHIKRSFMSFWERVRIPYVSCTFIMVLKFSSAPFFLHDCLQCFRETLLTEIILYSSIKVLDSVIHAKTPLSK